MDDINRGLLRRQALVAHRQPTRVSTLARPHAPTTLVGRRPQSWRARAMTDGPEAAHSRFGDLCRSLLAITSPAGLEHASVCRTLHGHLAGAVFSSSPAATSLMSLQETLGEGPTVTAVALGRPVLISDLTDDPLTRLWVMFGREAEALGVRSVYALPLRIGAIGVGVLTLHGPQAIVLTPELMPNVLRMHDALAMALLLPTDGFGDLDIESTEIPHNHAVTNQAAGMVMAQIDSNFEGALLRLRAHAVGSGQTLAAVAQQIVSRTLRFRPESGEEADETGANDA